MRLLPFGRPARRSDRADAAVTGAGSGFGGAFAVELGRLGPVCDVSDGHQVREPADSVQKWFGGAPGLVTNNDGISAGGNVARRNVDERLVCDAVGESEGSRPRLHGPVPRLRQNKVRRITR